MDNHEELAKRDELSLEEIDGEQAVSLPDKEVLSLLDINADVDLGLDLAAPVDLAAAANLNVAAPIEAAAAANLLSPDAEAVALAQQSGSIEQVMTGVDANAQATQDASIGQSGTTDDVAGATEQAALADGTAPEAALLADGTVGDVAGDTTGTVGDTTGTVGDVVDGTVGDTVGDTTGTVGDTVGDTTGTIGDTVDDTTDTVGGVSSLLDGGNLLEANVNIDADANVTAPIAGAVAANGNIAAPIDAAVAANIGSEGAVAQSMAVQDVDIVQQMDDVEANATADQDADVQQ